MSLAGAVKQAYQNINQRAAQQRSGGGGGASGGGGRQGAGGGGGSGLSGAVASAYRRNPNLNRGYRPTPRVRQMAQPAERQDYQPPNYLPNAIKAGPRPYMPMIGHTLDVQGQATRGLLSEPSRMEEAYQPERKWWDIGALEGNRQPLTADAVPQDATGIWKTFPYMWEQYGRKLSEKKQDIPVQDITPKEQYQPKTSAQLVRDYLPTQSEWVKGLAQGTLDAPLGPMQPMALINGVTEGLRAWRNLKRVPELGNLPRAVEWLGSHALVGLDSAAVGIMSKAYGFSENLDYARQEGLAPAEGEGFASLDVYKEAWEKATPRYMQDLPMGARLLLELPISLWFPPGLGKLKDSSKIRRAAALYTPGLQEVVGNLSAMDRLSMWSKRAVDNNTIPFIGGLLRPTPRAAVYSRVNDGLMYAVSVTGDTAGESADEVVDALRAFVAAPSDYGGGMFAGPYSKAPDAAEALKGIDFGELPSVKEALKLTLETGEQTPLNVPKFISELYTAVDNKELEAAGLMKNGVRVEKWIEKQSRRMKELESGHLLATPRYVITNMINNVITALFHGLSPLENLPNMRRFISDFAPHPRVYGSATGVAMESESEFSRFLGGKFWEKIPGYGHYVKALKKVAREGELGDVLAIGEEPAYTRTYGQLLKNKWWPAVWSDEGGMLKVNLLPDLPPNIPATYAGIALQTLRRHTRYETARAEVSKLLRTGASRPRVEDLLGRDAYALADEEKTIIQQMIDESADLDEFQDRVDALAQVIMAHRDSFMQAGLASSPVSADAYIADIAQQMQAHMIPQDPRTVATTQRVIGEYEEAIRSMSQVAIDAGNDVNVLALRSFWSRFFHHWQGAYGGADQLLRAHMRKLEGIRESITEPLRYDAEIDGAWKDYFKAITSYWGEQFKTLRKTMKEGKQSYDDIVSGAATLDPNAEETTIAFERLILETDPDLEQRALWQHRTDARRMVFTARAQAITSLMDYVGKSGDTEPVAWLVAAVREEERLTQGVVADIATKRALFKRDPAWPEIVNHLWESLAIDQSGIWRAIAEGIAYPVMDGAKLAPPDFPGGLLLQRAISIEDRTTILRRMAAELLEKGTYLQSKETGLWKGSDVVLFNMLNKRFRDEGLAEIPAHFKTDISGWTRRPEFSEQQYQVALDEIMSRRRTIRQEGFPPAAAIPEAPPAIVPPTAPVSAEVPSIPDIPTPAVSSPQVAHIQDMADQGMTNKEIAKFLNMREAEVAGAVQAPRAPRPADEVAPPAPVTVAEAMPVQVVEEAIPVEEAPIAQRYTPLEAPQEPPAAPDIFRPSPGAPAPAWEIPTWPAPMTSRPKVEYVSPKLKTPRARIEWGIAGSPNNFSITTPDGAKVIGIVGTDFGPEKITANYGELWFIEVPEKLRRKGIATSLVDDLVKVMKANGVDTLIRNPVSEAGRGFIKSTIGRVVDDATDVLPSGKGKYPIRGAKSPATTEPVTLTPATIDQGMPGAATPAPEVIPTPAPEPAAVAAAEPFGRGDIVDYEGRLYEVVNQGGLGGIDIALPGQDPIRVMPQQVTKVASQEGLDLTETVATELPPVAPVRPYLAKVFNYSKDLKITNLDQLQKGSGARYLEITEGQGDDLVAVKWHKKLPKQPMQPGQHYIDFKKPDLPVMPAGATELDRVSATRTVQLENHAMTGLVFDMRNMASTMINELAEGVPGSKMFTDMGAEGTKVTGIPSTNPYWYRQLFADGALKSKPTLALRRIMGGTDTNAAVDTLMRRTIIERLAEGEDELMGVFPPNRDALRIIGENEESIAARLAEFADLGKPTDFSEAFKPTDAFQGMSATVEDGRLEIIFADVETEAQLDMLARADFEQVADGVWDRADSLDARSALAQIHQQALDDLRPQPPVDWTPPIDNPIEIAALVKAADNPVMQPSAVDEWAAAMFSDKGGAKNAMEAMAKVAGKPLVSGKLADGIAGAAEIDLRISHRALVHVGEAPNLETWQMGVVPFTMRGRSLLLTVDPYDAKVFVVIEPQSGMRLGSRLDLQQLFQNVDTVLQAHPEDWDATIETAVTSLGRTNVLPKPRRLPTDLADEVATYEVVDGNVKRVVTPKPEAPEVPVQAAPAQAPAEVVEQLAPALGPEAIAVRLGADWIPRDVYDGWLKELGVHPRYHLYPPDETNQSYRFSGTFSEATAEMFSTDRLEVGDIMEAAFNGKPVGDAQSQVDALQKHFSQWVWKDQNRTDRLAKLYNETPTPPVQAAVPTAREQLARRIAEASREPLPEVIQMNRLMGSDGKWYGGGGFPGGVTFTGEKQPYWVATTPDGRTFGSSASTQEEVATRVKNRQDAQVEEFYQTLLRDTDKGLASQQRYWLKEEPTQAPAVPEMTEYEEWMAAREAVKAKPQAHSYQVERSTFKANNRMAQQSANKVLDASINYGEGYGTITRREFLERASSEGATISLDRVEMPRRKNLSPGAIKEQLSITLANGDNFSIGKIEREYFEHLEMLKPTPEQLAKATPPADDSLGILPGGGYGAWLRRSLAGNMAKPLDAVEGARSLNDAKLHELQMLKAQAGKYWENNLGPADADTQTALMAWMDSVAQPRMSAGKLLASKLAKDDADFIMLDYGNTKGFDTALGLAFPYSYWNTRSAFNWTKRLASHPLVLPWYLRYREYKKQKRQEDKGLRPRFWESLKLNVPEGVMPDWLESALYFNPDNLIFPFANWRNQDWDDAEGSNVALIDVLRNASQYGLAMHQPLQYLTDLIDGKPPGKMKDYFPLWEVATSASAVAREAAPELENVIPAGGFGFGPGAAGGKYDPLRLSRMLASMAADAMQMPNVDYANPQEVLKAAYAEGKADLAPLLPYLNAGRQVEKWNQGKLSPAEVEAMRELPMVAEAMQRAALERATPVLSSWATALRLTPVAKGEKTQVMAQAAEKEIGYNPLTGEGSRQNIRTYREANPFVQARWAIYGSLPGEQEESAERIYWNAFEDELKTRVHDKYNEQIMAVITANPADHKGIAALNAARYDEIDTAMADMPKQEGSPRLWSITGARPEEVWSIRADQILYELNKSQPETSVYTNKDGSTDWDAFFAAKDAWYEGLAVEAESNPTINSALMDFGDERQMALTEITAPAVMKAYQRRNHDPLTALHEVVWDKYNGLWDTYHEMRGKGTSSKVAWNKTIGAMAATSASAWIDEVQAAYPEKNWDSAMLQALYATVANVPSAEDIYDQNKADGTATTKAKAKSGWVNYGRSKRRRYYRRSYRRRSYRRRSSRRRYSSRRRGGGGGGGGGGGTAKELAFWIPSYRSKASEARQKVIIGR